MDKRGEENETQRGTVIGMVLLGLLIIFIILALLGLFKRLQP